jgi:hypothetical protein
MSAERRRGLWTALAWFIFPVVPVVLENSYHDFWRVWMGMSLPQSASDDPYAWDWTYWLIQLGPLIGFGFLVGATLAVADEPTRRRGLRGWLSKRSLWVALGPWAGMLTYVAAYWLFVWLVSLLPDSVNQGNATAATAPSAPSSWEGSWTSWALGWLFSAFLLVTFSYAWLLPGIATLLQARRAGSAWSALKRGLAVSIAFVGSLFGSFWAVTQVWRDYFFDPRIVPGLLMLLSVGALSGCTSTVTYGEVRRRELFGALLTAWMFGLAVAWRWLSRRKPRPGPPVSRA